MGGFIWVVVLSIVFIVQGKKLEGCLGLVVACVGIGCILSFSPWRFPSTPFWKLMMAPYIVFFASAAWTVWSYGPAVRESGLNWWNTFWILLIFSPVITVGRRKWTDGDVRQ
jgi:hypothetical protein